MKMTFPAIHADSCPRRQGGVCACRPLAITKDELERNVTPRQKDMIRYLMSEIERIVYER